MEKNQPILLVARKNDALLRRKIESLIVGERLDHLVDFEILLFGSAVALNDMNLSIKLLRQCLKGLPMHAS